MSNLRKKQKNGAKWKRLWFVLKDGILYAFKAPEDGVPSDTFPILGYKLEILSEVRYCVYCCLFVFCYFGVSHFDARSFWCSIFFLFTKFFRQVFAHTWSTLFVIYIFFLFLSRARKHVAQLFSA